MEYLKLSAQWIAYFSGDKKNSVDICNGTYIRMLANIIDNEIVKTINHQLYNKDVYIPKWKVKHLFLGTFNPLGGARVNYYYGRDRNKTWELLSQIFCTTLDTSDTKYFFSKLEKNEIACMDMIHSLTAPSDRIESIMGQGYKDSKIINKSIKRNYNTSKILEIVNSNPGIKVYSTWGNGSKLKEWQSETLKIKGIIPLVSPSMAAKIPKGKHKFEYMLADWKKKIKTFANNRHEGKAAL